MDKRILVIEDEQDLADILAYNLRQAQVEPMVALNGADGLALLNGAPPPDLLILDLMLPDISGMEICRRVRAQKRTAGMPILMLTARGEEIDRVMGFEAGADDYVTKPFSVRELMLRVKALLKRTAGPVAARDEGVRETHEVVFGVLRIDLPGHRIIVGGQERKVTVLEFKLLTTLMERRGRVQTREMLLNDVWDMSADVTTRTVDTHVKRLRAKIGEAGRYIETVRGVGYRFKKTVES